jgi:hypothetical protein
MNKNKLENHKIQARKLACYLDTEVISLFLVASLTAFIIPRVHNQDQKF